MLVLTRKKGESIMIGDNVEVVILGTDGDQVKVGIKAPKTVQVFRSEIYETILQSNREAMNSSIDMGDLAKIQWNLGKKGD